MLIVCPNCATSYMIDPASVGPAGRAVRCARCRSTWFAGAGAGTGKASGAPGVSTFVSGVIAEAEAQANGQQQPQQQDTPPQFEQNPVERFEQDPAERFEAPASFAPEQSPDTAPDAGHSADYGQDGGAQSPPIYDDSPEPVTIADAPSLVPPNDYDTPHGHPYSDTDEAESFVVRRQRMKEKRQRSKRTSRWTAVILVLFAVNVALIGARHEVVRYLPQTASLFAAVGLPVNLRNLQFDKVKITKETQDGVSILIIEGTIMNTANKPTDVPRLRFAARNPSGLEVYTWTAQPSRSILGPLESMEFSSRLAAPPSDATDVMVRFFTAQDVASGGGK